jgi:ATP-binding cassette subfamily C protein
MAMLLPLLNMVGVGAAGAGGLITGYIEQAFALAGMRPTLETILGTIVVLFVLQGCIVLLQGRMIASIEAAYVSHWREALLEKMLGATWSYLSTQKTGSLVYLIIADAERLGRAFLLLTQLVAVLIVMLVYGAIALAISPGFTVALLVSLLLMSGVFVRLSSNTSYRSGRDYGRHVDELQALLTDFIAGAKLVKATAAEAYVMDRVRPIHRRIEHDYFGGVVVPYTLKAVMELAGIALLCALIYVGVRVLEMQTGALLVLLAIFFRLVPRLYNAQYNMQLLATYLPAFQKLESAMQELVGAKESYIAGSGESRFTESPDISMGKVTVTYGGRDALSDVSLEIPARATVGIVGPSGAGKSTLVDCLAGLVMPRLGTTSIGGVSIERLDLKRWRSSIGYVAQETVLFDGTVREIICQGRPISDETLIRAAEQAHAHAFIAELPQGYDTFVGARGVQLSGGQKQRLSLARALAGQPVMLILDEPTSALDAQSETEIMTAIRELKGRRTIVVVSHRMSAVQHADKLIVLDQGRIAGEGPWERLQATESLHALLAHS